MLKAGFGEREKLRDAREVPVRVRHVRVPQEGGEDGQPLFDIDASAIPTEKRRHSKVMSKIVKPRAGVVSQAAESDLPRELNKRPSDHTLGQRPSLVGKEEARRGRLGETVIPKPAIAIKHRYGGRMEWHQARLAELGEADRQERLPQVNVRSIKTNNFPDPHAGYRQKTEDCVICLWPETAARPELCGGLQKSSYLFTGIDVRGDSSEAKRQEADGWDLRPGVESTPMPGK